MDFIKSVAALRVDPDAPARMIIRGFDGLPLTSPDGSISYIDIYSIDSAVAREHQRTTARKLVAAAAERSEAEIFADGVDLFVALTAGWGIIDDKGAAHPDSSFTKEAARALYADKENVEIRAQVDRFAGTRRNFSKASSSD